MHLTATLRRCPAPPKLTLNLSLSIASLSPEPRRRRVQNVAAAASPECALVIHGVDHSFSPRSKPCRLLLRSQFQPGLHRGKEDSLDPNKVKGKLVYSKLGTYGTEAIVKAIGGIGAIIERQKYHDVAQVFMAPSTIVNNSSVMYRAYEIKKPAPFVATFSSRGPNPRSQHILKPDIATPDIDILTLYTFGRSITGLKGTLNSQNLFTLFSGTSMACPHVAGVVAYMLCHLIHIGLLMQLDLPLLPQPKPVSKKINIEA
ncbi:hypothetical protein PIB30_020625 [Stylosanthes scabra]|uniref:Peptidase S8/S53 domain-containing protein n=1 Tax=Stylosanthes scabra TaxID=79078 RepID=A0ABU6S8R5_9FABA|nr:hypothetical protein [Stylosanthes scabra]